MFIRYYVVVDRPFEETERRFISGAEDWMPVLARQADGDGSKLLSELGVRLPGGPHRPLELELGTARRTEAVTLIPLHWGAAEAAAGGFPTLDGQVELARVGTSTTQIGVSATYQPPPELELKIADRAMLHRVAEATLENFLEQVADRLARKTRVA
jgi:hypothetical protein